MTHVLSSHVKHVAMQTWKDVNEDLENMPEEDKLTRRKLERKRLEEEARQKALHRKLQNQEILQKEVEESLKEGKLSPQKKAYLAVKEEHEKREEAARKAKTSIMEQNIRGIPITETQLRHEVEGPKALALDSAIAKMNIKDDVNISEMHPAHQMLKTYLAFEGKKFPELVKEHMNMRPSEIKQLIHRLWLTSPENPMNKPGAKCNVRRGEKERSKHPPAIVKV